MWESDIAIISFPRLRITRNRLAAGTVILIFLSISVAFCWLSSDRHPEPLLTSFVLIATVLGVFGDRWVAEKEKRANLLKV